MAQKAFPFLFVNLILAVSCFAGVTINSPAPGSTSASPVHFVASATSGASITAMRIYVDNVSVFLTSNSSLDTLVSMSTGSHFVVVQAWDSSGGIFKASETINVTASTGVVVSAPANNATVASPFQVVASASAPNPVTAMQIYLDNQLVLTVNAASLNTPVSTGAGSHLLVVQAWDSTGAVYKQPVSLNVSSGIPANATVKSQIEDMSGWQSCTVCAGANGNGPTAAFSMQQFQSSPSLDGSSAKFNISGSTAYADALWWNQLGPSNSATNFVYDLDFYLTNPQAPQALEFDVNQSIGNLKFIFGTQCAMVAGVWDVWDAPSGVWRSTGVACTRPAALTWHHLTWEFQRTSTQTVFVAFTFDGVKHFVNMAFNALPVNAQELNVAFQMDLNSAAQAYSVWLDNVTLSYW